MPPRSLAEKILQEYKEDENTGSYLVVYDFHGEAPSSRFYTNLQHFKDEKSKLIQYSVFYTTNQTTAKSVRHLAEHYGAEAIIFQGNIKEMAKTAKALANKKPLPKQAVYS